MGSRDADYTTIQEAVNAAKNGATIVVQKGSYNERIYLNKTITLIGEDKNTTIISLILYNSTYLLPIVNIYADSCSIENLQITQSANSVKTGGISIYSQYNTIKNTIISNVTDGIRIVSNSESNTIQHNEIKNNQIGIATVDSVNNTISHNMLSHNQQYNIYLSTDSDNNNVSSNTLETSAYGMRIKGSQDNNVFNNCITNNDRGLYCCCGARSNHFYNNTFFNNSINAEENANLLNIWYDYPNGPGNYWDDYNGSDLNHDGIGDTPYLITVSKNQDLYPLLTLPLDAPCTTYEYF